MGRLALDLGSLDVTATALVLSRLQFVWVIAWHSLLPALTVGLASYIAVLEGLYLNTHRDLYFRLSNFWTRIFGISFGMGVVSGMIMPFQIGTNWSRFSDATANVLSPLLASSWSVRCFCCQSFLCTPPGRIGYSAERCGRRPATKAI
jgi:cytochrome d ubiquinol oxidase subunit I